MKIDLLGTSFTIQTDEDPQYVQDLVDYLHTKVQEIQRRVPGADELKVAILAGVLIADELFRARDGGDTPPRDQAATAASEIAERLINTLDRSLVESEEPHSTDSSG